jgi:hypothetical protein
VSWAEKHGMTVIRSAERANTYGLIGEADYVLVNGSSAGVEGGLMGRKIVCVGHATYERSGLCTNVFGPEDLPQLDALSDHDPVRTTRYALRYLYTHGRRFAQFVQNVRAVSTLRYEYFEGADAERIVRLCRSGRLEPDDSRYGEGDAFETRVVQRMLKGEWESLGEWQETFPTLTRMTVRRRFGLRWMDNWRQVFARGDL